MLRRGVGAAALPLLVAAALTTGCDSNDAPTRDSGVDTRTRDARAASVPPPAATDVARGAPAPFRACGLRSGGYRLRAAHIGCQAASRVVRHFRAVRMLGEFRFRDPDAEPVAISREVVWRVAGGWDCLAQALPAVRVTQFLCVRGGQVLLWRMG